LAHNESRKNYDALALSYLETNADVFLGGGQKYFPPALLEQFKAKGYQHISRFEDLASITQPNSSAQFAVGQTIQVRGQASDAEQGQLPASGLSWKVILHHDTHTHPYLTQPTTNSFSFTAPAPEDLLAASNSYLELELTATDDSGLSHVVTQTIQPHKVNVTLASTPNANANFVVNNDPIEADDPFISWENYSLRVTAPAYADSNRWWRFVRWSDNNTSNPRTFTTPASATTYTAVYEEFIPYQLYLPVVRK